MVRSNCKLRKCLLELQLLDNFPRQLIWVSISRQIDAVCWDFSWNFWPVLTHSPCGLFFQHDSWAPKGSIVNAKGHETKHFRWWIRNFLWSNLGSPRTSLLKHLLIKQIIKVSSDSERGISLNISIKSITKNLWLSLNSCQFEK